MPYIELDGKRILYVHVPKTGGTSVETWLAGLAPIRFRTVGIPAALNCTPQHLRFEDLEALFGEGAFDYAFMTVRNPFDRIASEFRMQARMAGEGFFGEAPRFGPWLERMLARAERDPWVLDNHLRPQWEFQGEGVEVFRLEDGLGTILARVAEQIGVAAPEKVEHALKTAGDGRARGLPPVRWTRPALRRIRSFYAGDFDEFGYPETPPGLA